MTKQPLNQKHFFFFLKAKIDFIAKRHVRFSPFPSFHIRQLTLEGRMKLNRSSCLFFGCECFGTCTCVCKLLILLCCQMNVFKSFRAKRGRGHTPLPLLVTHAHFGSIFCFFRTDLATGLCTFMSIAGVKKI